MITYSVTISVDEEIVKDWVQWMKKIHIPEVMATGCFVNYKLQRLIDPEPEVGASTFNIQYDSPSMDSYEDYRDNFAEGLQKAHLERYKDRFVALRTLLEVL